MGVWRIDKKSDWLTISIDDHVTMETRVHVPQLAPRYSGGQMHVGSDVRQT